MLNLNRIQERRAVNQMPLLIVKHGDKIKLLLISDNYCFPT
jgi:hypothetical protein